MNKNLLLVLFFMCSSTASFAQIPTLTGTNINPAVNDSFISVICDTNGISQGNPGAGVTWDFSSTLLPSTLVYPIDTGYAAYAATGPGYSLLSLFSTAFATSNITIETPASSLANYYIANSTSLSFTGLYMSTSNNAVYTNPMDMFHFPFTYLNTFTDPYAGAITYMGASLTEAGSVTVTADGYGKLILPPTPPSATPATYNGVLRVHSLQLFTDSLNIFGSTPQTVTIETYTWYQPGYHSALLTIATTSSAIINNKVVSYAQKQIANHEGVPSMAGVSESLKLYPNPANNEVSIVFNTPTNEKVKVSLIDMLGREVAVISDRSSYGEQNISYNTSSLPKGLYLVRVQSGSETVTRKIEIQ